MKNWLLVAAVVAVLAGMAVGARLVHIHDTYGEWRLTATETPNRITALGRDYDRSDMESLSSAPSGFVDGGEAGNGGATFVPRSASRSVPVVIYLRDAEGRFWSYALVGGP